MAVDIPQHGLPHSQPYEARKKHKTERTVNSNLDPAGLTNKVEGGKMLDPTDPKSVDKMHEMLKALSHQVWRPLKTLIGESLGASLEYPAAFLKIFSQEADRLYEHTREAGVTYVDMANLYTLLALSFAFQRSQVLRDSTVHEFTLAPDETHYRLRFKERTFKTASASGGGSSAPPVSHFNLSPDQSIIIKYIATVGHRFCGINVEDEARWLFVNAKGEKWTQGDIAGRFKRVGAHWLGIPSFCPHACRTFWATHSFNSGQIDASNVDDFGSYLQVSTATIRSSYMSASANAAAHTLGSEVLGGIVNAACTGETSKHGAKPSTKKLGARRMEFISEIRPSLLKYGGETRLLFRDLVSKRKASQLGER